MKDEEDEEEKVSLNKLLSSEKEEAPSSARLCLTPAAEGQPLLWIPEGIKRSPHLSPGDDHSDDTNHSGGVVLEICERLLQKRNSHKFKFIPVCLTCFFPSTTNLRVVCWPFRHPVSPIINAAVFNN